MTQKAVAELLGITPSSYTKKENGGIPFSLKEVKLLKEIFVLETEEFMRIFFEK